MTVDAAYNFIKFLARKNQTGSITPTEFAAAFNSGQRSYFDELLGKITVRPHVALGQNERIAEKLRPFKVTDQNITVASQIAPYPALFQAITSMTNTVTGKAMTYLDDAKLRARLKSAIDPIAEANPAVFTNTDTGWKVWPTTISQVSVSFYKEPTNVSWGFTVDGNGRSVYNVNASVQPLWDNVSCEEILARACRLLGFSFEKQSLVQFGDAAKAIGV